MSVLLGRENRKDRGERWFIWEERVFTLIGKRKEDNWEVC